MNVPLYARYLCPCESNLIKINNLPKLQFFVAFEKEYHKKIQCKTHLQTVGCQNTLNRVIKHHLFLLEFSIEIARDFFAYTKRNAYGCHN